MVCRKRSAVTRCSHDDDDVRARRQNPTFSSAGVRCPTRHDRSVRSVGSARALKMTMPRVDDADIERSVCTKALAALSLVAA